MDDITVTSNGGNTTTVPNNNDGEERKLSAFEQEILNRLDTLQKENQQLKTQRTNGEKEFLDRLDTVASTDKINESLKKKARETDAKNKHLVEKLNREKINSQINMALVDNRIIEGCREDCVARIQRNTQVDSEGNVYCLDKNGNTLLHQDGSPISINEYLKMVVVDHPHYLGQEANSFSPESEEALLNAMKKAATENNQKLYRKLREKYGKLYQ